MHYWNQRVHGILDRFAALDLLDWCQHSKLPEALSYFKQHKLLNPLNSLGADYSIEADGKNHYICLNGKKREIIAYPAMWSTQYIRITTDGVVAVSDKLLKYALPKADSVIREQI